MQKSLVLLAVITLVASGPATAQLLPFSIEARAGAAFPTGDLAEEGDVDTGFGFELNGKYQIIPLLGVYAAYDRFEFSGDSEGPEEEEFESELTDEGFALGAQLSLPFPGLGPWIRGGVIYNKATIGGSGGGLSLSIESDRTLGFEVGGGLSFPIGPTLSITPGIRYRAYSPEFDILGESSSPDFSYLVADIGLSMSF